MVFGFIEDVVDAAGDAFEAGADWVAGAAEDAADAIVGAAEDIADAVGDAAEAIVGAVEDVADAIGDAAEAAVDAIEDAVDDALEELGDAVDDIWEAAQEVWDDVTHAVEDAWEVGAEGVEEAGDSVAAAAEEAWSTISEAAEDAWDAVATAAEDSWNAAVDAAEEAWERAEAVVTAGVDAMVAAYEWAVQAATDAIEWLGGLIVDLAELFAQLGACLAGQVVYRVAKAGNIIANIDRPPRLLPAAFRSSVVRVFGGGSVGTAVNTADFATVLVIDDALLSANWFSSGTDAMCFGGTSYYGVTVGGLIFLDQPWDPTVEADAELMAHELVHTTQQRRFVNETGFACAYGIGFAQAGFDYRSNPLEQEAYDFVTRNRSLIAPLPV